MRTCLKCNHVATGTPDACPQCGAIYAKVEAAANAGNSGTAPKTASHRLSRQEQIEQLEQKGAGRAHLWRLVGYGLVLAMVVALGYGATNTYQKRQERLRQEQAALDYCGATAFSAWRLRFDAAIAEFDRTGSAASVSPRMTLAPLILRMSEAVAATEKTGPPPCALSGVNQVLDGMNGRVKAFRMFALSENAVLVEAEFRRADEEARKGLRSIAEASDRVVSAKP